MTDFDADFACPLTKNAWCSTTDCPFYNSELEECSLWRRQSGYNELQGSITGATTTMLDLGQIYKDMTIWVDKACIIQIGGLSAAQIHMTVASGRVGTPLVMTDIWARYIYITTAETTEYIITGNG